VTPIPTEIAGAVVVAGEILSIVRTTPVTPIRRTATARTTAAPTRTPVAITVQPPAVARRRRTTVAAARLVRAAPTSRMFLLRKIIVLELGQVFIPCLRSKGTIVRLGANPVQGGHPLKRLGVVDLPIGSGAQRTPTPGGERKIIILIAGVLGETRLFCLAASRAHASFAFVVIAPGRS
jgi:hypothetical protein